MAEHAPDKVYTLQDLKDVMQRLRDPQTGCPWDLEQDFKTIAPYTIEEAYEVADAINRGTMDDLKDELGDLLFQAVFHSQMAAEQGAFTLDDVISHVTAKMISRHPHVFGDDTAQDSTQVLDIWEQRKAAEKAAKAQAPDDASLLDDVTLHLPALLRSQKLQKKAGKAGFEWPDVQGVLQKLQEEINELEQAVKNESSTEISEEFGDVLFVLVNYGRRHGIDCETALRNANDKFCRRFKGMEQLAKAEGKDFSQLKLAAQDALWNRVKSAEKKNS